MSNFEDLIHRQIILQSAEVCTYVTREIAVSAGVSDLIRQSRGLPCRLSVTQSYLHLRTFDGLEGWYGPLNKWSNVTPLMLIEKVRLLGRNTSIARAYEVLKPIWTLNPTSCGAVDCTLWDLVCRGEGLPLWRVLLNERKELRTDPSYYGSALGLSLEHVDILVNVLEAGYPLAKWTLNVHDSIEEQLLGIRSLGIGWHSIALDAHGRLNIAQVKRIHQLAPSLSWLEDPFSLEDHDKWLHVADENGNRLPLLIVGEDVGSADRLEEIIAFPVVHKVNLEVERLGITGAVFVLRNLKAKGRTCNLHGRSLVIASHLAVAYPEVVCWVESHLAFALERLATILHAESAQDPRAIVRLCLEKEGIGTQPSAEMEPLVFSLPL